MLTQKLILHFLYLLFTEQKDTIKGLVVAIGTMMTNYTVCFPIVVFRHGLQALSHPDTHTWSQDTPSRCFALLKKKYQDHGFRGLYSGFGLGLFSQAITAAYESFLAGLAKKLSLKLDRTYQQYILAAVHKCLRYAIHIPLYSLSKTALVLRVQSQTQPLISSPMDFLRYYYQDLKHLRPSLQPSSLWTPTPTSSPLSFWSTFLPSFLFNLATEKCMMYLYKRTFKYLTKGQRQSTSRRRRSASVTTNINNLDTSHSPPTASSLSRSSSASVGLSTRDRSIHENKKDPATADYEPSMLQSYYPEIVCGMSSSMITRALSYPMDTVIFKLMIQDTNILSSPDQHVYTGFFDCCCKIYAEGGWRGFFPGWGAGVLELTATWMILEASWWTYRVMDQRLSASSSSQSQLH
ncbi:mitochondrial carrier domain-containing protein [Absidia repens]|uniref:Mitochondrial carrier domain-containing protein n=1 Tax=Absidia repens TaxID=90262 RepID=A0A1X2IV97_9FUNG|nr:mitochondrial carrier domain-containing protein [Absidia repens]